MPLMGQYQEILVPHSRWLHAAPMFHIADCAGLFGVSQAGGSHFFIPGFVPKAIF